MTVQHDADHHRFTLDTGAGTAELVYETRGSALAYVHTFVPKDARGQDVGSALVRAGLDHAREKGLGVIPACPFVKSYMERHPETQDLIGGGA